MRVEKLLKRLKREFIKVNLLQAALDSILFFLAFNLVLFLFSLRVTESFTNIQVLLTSTFSLFMLDLAYRTNKYRLEIYEEKNPELQEILRTARDNLSSNNIVSQAMFDELMDRSRSVTSESIIPSKRIIQKILAVGVLSFLTVTSGIADFQVIREQGHILPELDTLEDITGQKEDDGMLKNATDIYGEPRDIESSNKLVSFNITGSGQSSNADLKPTVQPEEIAFDSANPGLPEDVELAKQYSLWLRGYEN